MLPIEVKSGKDYHRNKALTNVLTDHNYDIDFAYVLTNHNVHIDVNRVYMPIYMLMFIHKAPSPEKQIFKFDLQNL